MGLAHRKGNAAGEAQTAYQDDGSDDQVAGVGKVHPVLHHIAHADGGDHAVQDEGHAADDGGGDGVDQGGKGGGEGQHHGIERRQPDHLGVVDPGEDQHAGILAVGGVGRAAEQAGQGGGDAVADEGAVEAGILDEIFAHGGGDGGHVPDMLHHGSDGDGGHDQDGGQVKFGHAAAEFGDKGLEAQKLGLGHGGEVHEGDQLAGGVDGGGAHGVGGEGHQVGDHHAQQDGDDLDHAPAPDVGDHDDGDGQNGQPPAGGGVGDGRGGQGQADEDDHGPGDHRRQEAHDLFDAHSLDDGGQHHIQQAGHHDTAAGVLELLARLHSGVPPGVQLGHGLEAAQVGKGGPQESGDLQLGTDMEKQGADPGEKQGGLDGQRQAVALDQDGDQHGGAEHGEHVLQAQDQHLGQAELPGVADGFIGVHVVSPSLFSLASGPHLGKKKTITT